MVLPKGWRTSLEIEDKNKTTEVCSCPSAGCWKKAVAFLLSLVIMKNESNQHYILFLQKCNQFSPHGMHFPWVFKEVFNDDSLEGP